MCNTSNDFTVSLDYVSHFLSIHKAELFLTRSQVGECAILFRKSYVERLLFAILFPFLQLKGANLLEKRNSRKPRRIQVTMLVHLYTAFTSINANYVKTFDSTVFITHHSTNS